MLFRSTTEQQVRLILYELVLQSHIDKKTSPIPHIPFKWFEGTAAQELIKATLTAWLRRTTRENTPELVEQSIIVIVKRHYAHRLSNGSEPPNLLLVNKIFIPLGEEDDYVPHTPTSADYDSADQSKPTNLLSFCHKYKKFFQDGKVRIRRAPNPNP